MRNAAAATLQSAAPALPGFAATQRTTASDSSAAAGDAATPFETLLAAQTPSRPPVSAETAAAATADSGVASPVQIAPAAAAAPPPPTAEAPIVLGEALNAPVPAPVPADPARLAGAATAPLSPPASPSPAITITDPAASPGTPLPAALPGTGKNLPVPPLPLALGAISTSPPPAEPVGKQPGKTSPKTDDGAMPDQSAATAVATPQVLLPLALLMPASPPTPTVGEPPAAPARPDAALPASAAPSPASPLPPPAPARAAPAPILTVLPASVAALAPATPAVRIRTTLAADTRSPAGVSKLAPVAPGDIAPASDFGAPAPLLPVLAIPPAALDTPALNPAPNFAAAGGTPPITAAPRDFAALIDRLVEARVAAQGGGVAATVDAAIAHSQFGQVSLRFERDAHGLTVNMTSADPGFARAASAALTPAPAAAAPSANGDSFSQSAIPGQSQPQSQSQSQSPPQSPPRWTINSPRAAADPLSPRDDAASTATRTGILA